MSYRNAVMAAKYAGGPVEQATTLHEHRFETVVEGTGYFGFDEPRGVVLHLVPKSVYDDGYAIDLSEGEVLPEANPERPSQLPVLGGDGERQAREARGTWTADGFGAAVEDESGRCPGYAHLFSNGVVESVSAYPFAGHPAGNGRLDARALELDLTRCTRRYLRVLAYHQGTAPIHVAVSLYGVEGCRVDPGADGESAEIATDVVAPFPTTIENFDADVRRELADPVDALWRAAGYPGSPFFDGEEWSLRSAFEASR